MPTTTKTHAEAPSTDVINHVRKEWNPAQEDEVSKLKKDYAEWIVRAQATQATAAKQLYDNPDSCPIQLRFHLLNFASLLSRGQIMVLKAFDLCSKGEAKEDFFEQEIANIDSLVPDLVDRLHAWHGSVDSQHDIPESFKRGVKDIDDGKVVDMDYALNAAR